MNSTSNFMLRLTAFSLVIAIAFYFLQTLFPPRMAFSGFWAIQLIVIAVTIGFHLGLLRAGAQSNQAFIRFFMGATAIKLFLFMTIMIGYALFNPETAIGFIIHFFLMYLLFTGFEVASIYRKLSTSKPNFKQ